MSVPAPPKPTNPDDNSTPQPPPATSPSASVSAPPAPADPVPAPDAPPDDKPPPAFDPNNPGDIIDMETFLQILDLDEEDNHDFSKGMAWAYFDQAATTFEDMDKAYDEKNLPKLSALGHFLKGSSAALGVSKVQASCERVQHYGDLRDEDLGRDLTDKEALAKILDTLTRVKVEYAEAERWLKAYYKTLGAGDEPPVPI
ncbi:histidine-phosphotransfer domain, HPT domain-containing protein [Ramaria rubella]|nr:histidine-phosphotransfer domain, HPT domain-containing protein [Ramaria rubella]